MKKGMNGLVVLFGVSFSLVACGWSPVLNHANPNRSTTDSNQNTNESPANGETSADCALYFKTQNLCANLEWVKTPSQDEAGSFKLYFYDKEQGAAQEPVFVNPQGQVSVKLWMPSMGHGSSPVKLAQAVSANGSSVEGVFDATSVFFVMPGAWEIRILLKGSNGQVTDQASLAYRAN